MKRSGRRIHACCAGLLLAVLAAPAGLAGPDDGAVLGAVRLLDNGSPAERFDLVLVGEGYGANDQERFAADARALLDALLTAPPFDRLRAALNVWRIDVASSQSGADDPFPCNGATGRRVQTYFDASFCTGGEFRGLLTVGHALLLETLDAHVPAWDQAVVVVNAAVPGGLGGSVTITSVYPGWERAVLHQIGHAAFGLADEYDYFRGCGFEIDRARHPAIEPVAPNVTVATDRAAVKWAELIQPETEVVTSRNPDCATCDRRPDPFDGEVVVGLFEGAHYSRCDAFRPTYRCMMRDLSAFCPVCSRRIVETLTPFLGARGNEPPTCDAGGPYVVECAGPRSTVQLDAGASHDAEGDALRFRWSGDFDGAVAEGPRPTVAFTGPGRFPVELRVSDGAQESVCATEVVVEDTTPPSLAAPEAVTVECADPAGTALGLTPPRVEDRCDADVRLDHDAPEIFPPGPTPVTWTVSDASGNTATAVQIVTVTDTTPPRLELSATPGLLWPVDHRLVPVTVGVAVQDACDSAPRVRLLEARSDEPDLGRGDGHTTGDIQGIDPGTDDREVLLRAERSGRGDRRVYTLTYEATDGAGNRSVGHAEVVVPHDRAAGGSGLRPERRAVIGGRAGSD